MIVTMRLTISIAYFIINLVMRWAVIVHFVTLNNHFAATILIATSIDMVVIVIGCG